MKVRILSVNHNLHRLLISIEAIEAKLKFDKDVETIKKHLTSVYNPRTLDVQKLKFWKFMY